MEFNLDQFISVRDLSYDDVSLIEVSLVRPVAFELDLWDVTMVSLAY